MATKDELIQQAKALRAELDRLETAIKDLSRGTWERAPHGGTYYYVGFCNTDDGQHNDNQLVKRLGKFSAVISTNDYSCESDIYNWETGNYFRTSEDAERSWVCRNTEARLRRLADKLNEKAGGLRWDDGIQCKYHLLYDGTTDKIITGEKYRTHYADMRTIHCVDKEFVTTARTMIGDDALLTYLGRK